MFKKNKTPQVKNSIRSLLMAQNAHTVAPITIDTRSPRTSPSALPTAKPAIKPTTLIQFAGVNLRKKIITKQTQN